MLQNTAQFIIFFIFAACLYYCIPSKARKVYLGLVNFLYAWLIGGVSTIVVVVIVSILAYFTGIYLEKISPKTGSSAMSGHSPDADNKEQENQKEGQNARLTDAVKTDSSSTDAKSTSPALDIKSDNISADAALTVKPDGYRKAVVAAFCVIVIGILIYGKYLNFSLSLIGSVLGRSFETVSVVAMVGISYYALSAISYIVDIYRGRDKADRNFLDVLLWTTFFTKLVAGPIERHDSFKAQMDKLYSVRFDAERIKRGFMIAAWGYFQKIIIADRAGLVVDNAFSHLDEREGLTLLIAAILYAFQVYLDFAGYSNIALGVSHIFGIKITQNFHHPFFATSITDLWRRWHISLSSWLKDYIYIPLGGSRKGKVRQYFNLVITFVISGLWHGAALSYAFWGFINGVYQICEKFYADLKKRGYDGKNNNKSSGIDVKQVSYDGIDQNGLGNVTGGLEQKTAAFDGKSEESAMWNKRIYTRSLTLVKMLYTFVLFFFSTMFFRAPSLSMGVTFVRRMLSKWNPWVLFDGTIYYMDLEQRDWHILIIGLIVLFIVEYLQEKNISIYALLQSQPLVVRWVFYYVVIFGLLVFGIYGANYDSSNFIYFRF